MADDEETQDDDGLFKPRKTVQETELDMTPMIDCTFLLLIYFTVAGKLDSTAELPLARVSAGVDADKCVIFSIIPVSRELNAPAAVYLGDAPNDPTASDQKPLTGSSEQIRAAVKAALEEGITAGKNGLLVKASGQVKEHEVTNVARAAGELEGISVYFGTTESE